MEQLDEGLLASLVAPIMGKAGLGVGIRPWSGGRIRQACTYMFTGTMTVSQEEQHMETTHSHIRPNTLEAYRKGSLSKVRTAYVAHAIVSCAICKVAAHYPEAIEEKRMRLSKKVLATFRGERVLIQVITSTAPVIHAPLCAADVTVAFNQADKSILICCRKLVWEQSFASAVKLLEDGFGKGWTSLHVTARSPKGVEYTEARAKDVASFLYRLAVE